MGEQQAIDHHLEDVHGVEDGITSLSEQIMIEVDSKAVFTIPSLLDIEILGQMKRSSLIQSVYTSCVAGGFSRITLIKTRLI